jgi:hypothetical protein
MPSNGGSGPTGWAVSARRCSGGVPQSIVRPQRGSASSGTSSAGGPRDDTAVAGHDRVRHTEADGVGHVGHERGNRGTQRRDDDPPIDDTSLIAPARRDHQDRTGNAHRGHRRQPQRYVDQDVRHQRPAGGHEHHTLPSPPLGGRRRRRARRPDGDHPGPAISNHAPDRAARQRSRLGLRCTAPCAWLHTSTSGVSPSTAQRPGVRPRHPVYDEAARWWATDTAADTCAGSSNDRTTAPRPGELGHRGHR